MPEACVDKGLGVSLAEVKGHRSQVSIGLHTSLSAFNTDGSLWKISCPKTVVSSPSLHSVE